LLAALASALAVLPGCFGNPGDSDQKEYVAIPYTVDGSDDAVGGDTRVAPDDQSPAGSDNTADHSDAELRVGVPVELPEGVQPGTLTAGCFDDNLNLEVYRDFISEVLQADVAAELPNLPLGQRILIHVQDEYGDPVGDARVVITAAGQDPQQPGAVLLMDRTTRTDGRLLFLTGLDDPTRSTTYGLIVYPPDGSDPVQEVRDLKNLEWDVTLAGTVGSRPARLDLAFVVDTTGSMADELAYLQSEVRAIVQAVADLSPRVRLRYALIVYRDEGDVPYVVRKLDFTGSVEKFLGSLAAQEAGGGGDPPEAMHLALEEAAELSWAARQTARVLFLIADAPPHSEFARRTYNAFQTLRAKTIAIYPVAASGVETRLEFFMRTAAFLTLGQYLFLTDDSGLGDPHAQPHLPCYHVQPLDRLMIQMIRTELSGTRLEPDPADILVTVGNPVGGVCLEPPAESGPNQ
jgi:Mg-chelatase subunit ChlD